MLQPCWALGGYDGRFFLEKTFNRETLVLRFFLGRFGPMLDQCWAYVGTMLGEERRVHLSPSIRAQMNRPF